MTCRLLVAKPIPEPMILCCQLDDKEQIFIETVFLQENVSENVVSEMTAISSQPQSNSGWVIVSK